MKKLNKKQIEHSQKVVQQAARHRKMKFCFGVGALLVLLFGLYFAFNPDHLTKTTGGVSIATVMGGIGSIAESDNSARAGKQVKSRLWLVSKDQIDDSIPFPSLVGRTRANIPLKAGEYWHYIDSVTDSPEPKWTGSEGDVATTLTNELPFIVGGMADAVFELMEKGVGKEFIVVWEICSTGERFGGGNGCKGLKLASFQGGSTKDNTSTTFTFKGECGELWYKYSGSTPTQAPVTVAANATTIVLTSNPQYQITGGTAAVATITTFTGITDSDVNRVVTLVGLGGTYPAEVEGVGFILNGGNAWVANAGAQISFWIYKDGAASYKLIEVSGSRISA